MHKTYPLVSHSQESSWEIDIPNWKVCNAWILNPPIISTIDLLLHFINVH